MYKTNKVNNLHLKLSILCLLLLTFSGKGMQENYNDQNPNLIILDESDEHTFENPEYSRNTFCFFNVLTNLANPYNNYKKLNLSFITDTNSDASNSEIYEAISEENLEKIDFCLKKYKTKFQINSLCQQDPFLNNNNNNTNNNNQYCNIFYYACKHNKYEIVKKLLNYEHTDLSQKAIEQSLYELFKCEDTEENIKIINLLLNCKKINLNKKINDFFGTPMRISQMNNRTEKTKLLSLSEIKPDKETLESIKNANTDNLFHNRYTENKTSNDYINIATEIDKNIQNQYNNNNSNSTFNQKYLNNQTNKTINLNNTDADFNFTKQLIIKKDAQFFKEEKETINNLSDYISQEPSISNDLKKPSFLKFSKMKDCIIKISKKSGKKRKRSEKDDQELLDERLSIKYLINNNENTENKKTSESSSKNKKPKSMLALYLTNNFQNKI